MKHTLDTDSQIFFYENDFYILSNFSAFSIQWKGFRFDTSEAVYHWEKFLFSNPGISNEIRLSNSAHEAFKLSEKYKEFIRPDWDDVKVLKMKNILRAKVKQHEYVRTKLLKTGNRELVENSWRDNFWGWGKNKNGLNMLGKLWMEIRKEIQEENPTFITTQFSKDIKKLQEYKMEIDL